ncbi:hypothetical protein HDU98_005853, partial [Podochytrium sp. JEL0797]
MDVIPRSKKAVADARNAAAGAAGAASKGGMPSVRQKFLCTYKMLNECGKLIHVPRLLNQRIDIPGNNPARDVVKALFDRLKMHVSNTREFVNTGIPKLDACTLATFKGDQIDYSACTNGLEVFKAFSDSKPKDICQVSLVFSVQDQIELRTMNRLATRHNTKATLKRSKPTKDYTNSQ